MNAKKICVVALLTAMFMLCCACGSDESSHDKKSAPVIAINSHEIVTDTDGFYQVIYTVENVSDQDIVFNGFSMKELDADNNIIDNYDSQNKAAPDVEMSSGETFQYELTFADEDNIDKIESKTYYFSDLEGNYYEEDFPEKYVVKIDR